MACINRSVMLRSVNGTSCKKKDFSRISSFAMRSFQNFPLRIWVHRLVVRLHFSKLLVVIVRPDKFVCWSHCSFLEQKRLVPLISGMLVEFRQGALYFRILSSSSYSSFAAAHVNTLTLGSSCPPPPTVISLRGRALTTILVFRRVPNHHILQTLIFTDKLLGHIYSIGKIFKSQNHIWQVK